VLAGKAIGTNAPFLLLQADGMFDGQEQRAGLRIEANTMMPADADSDVMLTATVSTPEWAAVDAVEFYINNRPERTSAPGTAARYGVSPDAVVRMGDSGWEATRVVVNETVPGAARTDIKATLVLEGITQDTWIVAIARGSDGVSEPLFPVLPASLKTSTNTTLEGLVDGNLGEQGTPAFAFTNPLFIDVNGDGWQAPSIP